MSHKQIPSDIRFYFQLLIFNYMDHYVLLFHCNARVSKTDVRRAL